MWSPPRPLPTRIQHKASPKSKCGCCSDVEDKSWRLTSAPVSTANFIATSPAIEVPTHTHTHTNHQDHTAVKPHPPPSVMLNNGPVVALSFTSGDISGLSLMCSRFSWRAYRLVSETRRHPLMSSSWSIVHTFTSSTRPAVMRNVGGAIITGLNLYILCLPF